MLALPEYPSDFCANSLKSAGERLFGVFPKCILNITCLAPSLGSGI